MELGKFYRFIVIDSADRCLFISSVCDGNEVDVPIGERGGSQACLGDG